MRKPRVLVITGPTASGKTSLAIEMAHRLNGEIVSADSMQIYREMCIGTALPTMEEREGIPHHVMEIISPDTPFSVAEYQKQAFAAIEDILSRGKLPIVCGGTGLYINSLTYRLNFTQTKENPALREELGRRFDADPEALFRELREKDPAAAERIHPNDKLRIVRRLEILSSGKQEDYDFNRENTDYDFVIFALNRDRAELYADIEARVDVMREMGLTEEARRVYDRFGGDITAFSAIGYKEFLPYFEGNGGEEEAYAAIKQNTRRFAKRQLTWFRRDPRIHWLITTDYSDRKEMAETVIRQYLENT